MSTEYLKIEQDSYRGYPYRQYVTLWEVSPSNPCLANPNTYIKRNLILTPDGEYRTFSGELVSGVFFTNPGGGGSLLKLNSGVIDTTYTVNCSPNIGESIDTSILGTAPPIHSAIYDGWVYVVYPSKHVVVKYEVGSNISGPNATGILVCGKIDSVDAGSAGQEAFLNTPTLISIDPISTNIIIYNAGGYKSFKEFSISGTFIRRWSDLSNPSTPNTSDLSYQDQIVSGPQNIKTLPTKLIGGLFSHATPLYLYSGDFSWDAAYSNFCNILNIDFRTINSKKVIIVSAWFPYNNKFKVWLVIEKGSKTTDFNCSVVDIHTVAGFTPPKSENETQVMAASTAIYRNNNGNQVEIAVVIPRSIADPNDYRKWTLRSLKFNLSDDDISVIDNISFNDIIKDQLPNSGNNVHVIGPGIKATAILNSSGDLICNFTRTQIVKLTWPYGPTSEPVRHIDPNDLTLFSEQYLKQTRWYLENYDLSWVGEAAKYAAIVVGAFSLIYAITSTIYDISVYSRFGYLLYREWDKFFQYFWDNLFDTIPKQAAITAIVVIVIAIAVYTIKWLIGKKEIGEKAVGLSWNSIQVNNSTFINGKYIISVWANDNKNLFIPEFLNVDVKHTDNFIYGVELRKYFSNVYNENNSGFMRFKRTLSINSEFGADVLYIPIYRIED